MRSNDVTTRRCWRRGCLCCAAVVVLAAGSSVRAHEDPPGCFETSAVAMVSLFRADQLTGVVGSVHECETIYYRALLQKGQDLDALCAFSGGQLTLTLPDGVTHTISTDVPCIGGNTGLEGCDPTVDFIQSGFVPYTVSPSDAEVGFITATASYAGGVAHDWIDNTPGLVSASPKTTPVGSDPTCTMTTTTSTSTTTSTTLADLGLVPPDAAVLRCEAAVEKRAATLAVAVAQCHSKAARAALETTLFDEEACAQEARTRYDRAVAKLKGCPACIAVDTSVLRERMEAHVAGERPAYYCAGTTPLRR